MFVWIDRGKYIFGCSGYESGDAFFKGQARGACGRAYARRTRAVWRAGAGLRGSLAMVQVKPQRWSGSAGRGMYVSGVGEDNDGE
jgi:hypothetical protein